MTIDINKKIFKKFKELEDCQGLSEIDIEDYFREVTEELLEDFILEKLNKQEEIYERDDENEEDL